MGITNYLCANPPRKQALNDEVITVLVM